MKQDTASKAVTGVGIFAAIAASLCCVTPLLALLAGASGAASSLEWLEPASPYLIGLAIATLGFAWYRLLGTRESTACGADGVCAVEKKNSSGYKTSLVIITIAAIALISFPNYADKLYLEVEKQHLVMEETTNINTASFNIKEMSCKACESGANREGIKTYNKVYQETKD